ncbi:MAG: OmpA family protein [Bacteroidota bacterium]
MKIRNLLLTSTLLLSVFLVNAQKAAIEAANEQYNKFSYLKTSEILLEVAENGYKSKEILQKLANSFYFNNKMKEASKWYGELFELTNDVNPEYYFRYAQALKSIENYGESTKWMKRFAEIDAGSQRANIFENDIDYLEKIDEASREIEIFNLDLNTELSDFGTNSYNGKLIFASSRGKGRKYQWNMQPFLDLYSAEKINETYANAVKLEGDINSKFHESTVAFMPDGKTMFFTRNNFVNKRLKKDKAGTNRLQLFRAERGTGGTWQNIRPVHFNSNDYSVAHPSINLDGTKMFFASDMPGTEGGSDIFVVDINPDGSLGSPENLSDLVNTPGRETFPFINEFGDLFISSDRLDGLGGLDIFVIRGFDDRSKSSLDFELQNIGRPINSSKDDFGYYEKNGTQEGFFTSNREGGKGDDDIYTFTVPECSQVVEGILVDEGTGEPLGNSMVTLLDKNGKQIAMRVVGSAAAYRFDNLECGKDYLIRVDVPQYSTFEKRFRTPFKSQELKMMVELERDEVALEPCADLAKILDIPIIYFDYGKSNIRKDAEIEIQKLLAVMKKYPTITMDIRSHTDCRGRASFNEGLSNRRAKSVFNYLVKKGVKADRLKAKGYGESRLINDCGCDSDNGKSCTEEEHQLNRRSEFIVTSVDGQSCPEIE